MKWNIVLIVTGEHELLLHSFMVERNEPQCGLVEGLHQVQVCFHFHGFELLSRVLVELEVLIVCSCCRLIMFIFVHCYFLCFGSCQLAVLVLLHVLSVFHVSLLNNQLIRVHRLRLVGASMRLHMLVVIYLCFLQIVIPLVEIID